MNKVLITGGSGFIGTRLTAFLTQKGYQVEHIGRTRTSKAGVKTWLWDIKKEYIEEGVFQLEKYDGFYLIHLAGEGILDRPWTPERKKSLVSSRADTLTFLYNACVQRNIFPKGLVSAGGISYYGMKTVEHVFTEADPPSADFIGQCCVQWEQAAHLFDRHCPVSVLRTSLVLDKNEGGLPLIDRKIMGCRPVVGTGRQWMPWVHIHDLCRAYVHALENGLRGPYNVVAPMHLTYRQLLQQLDPGFFIPLKVPLFLVKLLYGERHQLVTESSRASGQKLQDTGFTFGFPDMPAALTGLYG